MSNAPKDSDEELEILMKELSNDSEESSTSKQDKDIKKTLKNIQYDDYQDTVKGYEDGSDEDIKVEDEFE